MTLASWVPIDDRTYDELFEHLRRRIPTERWDDHNPSDTGIALLELFAWLGEMALFRMGRTTRAQRDKFLRLLVDPPEPVTVKVDCRVTAVGGGDVPASASVTIPVGTLLATDFAPPGTPPNTHGTLPKRYEFETIESVRLRRVEPGTEPAHLVGCVTARERTVVEDELLGTTTGVPDERFPLEPSRADLGLPADHPVPVLLDFARDLSVYDPNPVVAVGGVDWEHVRFLRTEASRVQGAPVQRFTVDAFDRAVVLGDGVYGSVPPAGLPVICRRYQVLQGPQALVPAGALRHVLTPVADLVPGLALTIASRAAQGGNDFVPVEQRAAAALVASRRPYRLVTADDFRRVLLEDFGDYQRALGQTDLVRHAQVFMNRRPPLASGAPAPGHVTVLLLTDGDLLLIEGDPAQPPMATADRNSLLAVRAAERGEVAEFLDRRRLITTHVHVVPPELVDVDLDVSLVVDGPRSLPETRARAEAALQAYLSARTGGFDGRGWRLGEGVYRSRLALLLEELEGVEHVDGLSLQPADAHGDVVVAPHQLVALRKPCVSVRRVT